MRFFVKFSILVFCAVCLFCGGCIASNNSSVKSKPINYKVKVVETVPHLRNAYTQGLFFHNNELYESTGQYGGSSFRKVNLKDGKVLRNLAFDAKYFVEGSCVIDGRLYILTWQENKCFVYDINSWKYLGELYNPREGWGLTTNGKDLILSDGSEYIYFLDPMNFAQRRKIKVSYNGAAVNFINELELIKGEIWANVYSTDEIVIIDPETGNVTGLVDCRNLLPNSLRYSNTDVLNGIAYDEVNDAIYLTGKYWPKMYRVELVIK